jgi:hypothetical protein
MNARMVGAILAAALISLAIAYAARWSQLAHERTEERVQVSKIQAVATRQSQDGPPDSWFLKQAPIEEAERHAEALAQIERDWWRHFVIVWLVVASVPIMLVQRKAQLMPDDEHLPT